MRSNSVKEQVNHNPLKSKKTIQFATLLSTYQNDKNKPNADKKNVQSNKSCSNHKSHLNNNDLGVNIKKNITEKLKPYPKSQNQVKRHNRSKTENLDLNLYQSSTLDLFKDIQFISKINPKKSQLKRQDSKKRLKTQSLKRINPTASSKTSSKEFKKYFNPIGQKSNDATTRQKKEKSFKKQSAKPNQQKQKLFESAQYNLQNIKGKFRKQKSDYEGESRTKIYSNKDQKKDINKTSNQNFSLLNLSQILHKSQYEQFLFPQQKQTRKKQTKQIKSARSSNSKLKPAHKAKVEALQNLNQLIDHFTSSITDQLQENSKGKKIDQKRSESKNYEIGGRSFSFMNQAINQEMKHGKSNFSTGVDSIGLDEQIQQLIKLKLKTQKQINHKISKQIKEIKHLYLTDRNDESNSSRKKIIGKLEMQKKSARTFRENTSEKTQNQNFEKLLLLDLLQKYNIMAGNLIPIIYKAEQTNPEQFILQNVPQKNYLQQTEIHRKHNQKYLEKFNQIAHKNKFYQEILNSLIRDGVNVEKYMVSYFKDK